MAAKELDFAKILFTGVKRKKPTSNLTASDSSELRIRLLPEAEEVQLKKPKKVEEPDEDNDENIKIFSSSASEKHLKQTEKKPERDIEAENRIQKISKIRRLNRIFIWGEDIPDPFIEFSDLKLSPMCLQNLTEFQIKEPSPIQMQAIPVMLQRRDLLASAPTGSGKSLAFILPIIKQLLDVPAQKLTTIILEPTRVLARQVYVQFVKYCQNLPIKYALYNDGEFPNDVQVVITTPHRIIAAVEGDKKILGKLKKLSWLVIDESDRLFDSGESPTNFKENLGKILKWCDGAITRKAFFSATISHEVEQWCKKHLMNAAMICIGARNASNTLVKQELIYAGSESGKISAIRDVLVRGFDPPALIFVQNKDRAGQLFAQIKTYFPQLPIELISSEITDKEKDKILDQVRDKTIFVLICTELIGRGIDLPSVNLVINFDIPTSIINYIHRVGRTGRGGKAGRAITYFTDSDLKYIRPIATVIHQAGFEVPSYTLTLEKPTKKEKKELQQNNIHRKSFGSVKKWEKVRNLKRVNDEIIEVDKIKGRILGDDDTGADVVGKVRKFQKRSKKKKAAKKNTEKPTVVKKSVIKKKMAKPVKKVLSKIAKVKKS